MLRIQELAQKGDKYFKFKDTKDFNSYFTQSQRIQRQKNQTLFQKNYGKSQMIHRCIASQSQYNQNLKNQFRKRYKQKQIQPSMKYSNRNQCKTVCSQRSRSMADKRKDFQNDQNLHNDVDFEQVGRRNTSLSSVSFLGSQDDARSNHTANTIKTQSQNSNISQKGTINVKRPNRKVIKSKTKQFSKSYFVGIIDIKRNTKDLHVKKSLNNILIKVGKHQPNSRQNLLPLTIQALHSQMD